jgi:DNA-binding MarR family transcriptional regulator
MAKMSENSRKVFDYMMSIGDNVDVTANDIATALGLSPKSVNGIITQAFQKKGLMERIPAEMENPDGTHKAIKLIKLTEAGKQLDPDAEE